MKLEDTRFGDLIIGDIFFYGSVGSEIEQFKKIGSEIAEGIFCGKKFFDNSDKVKIEVDESI